MNQESPIMNFGNIEFTYSVVPTKRKTVGVVVEPNGNVIIKAPLDLDDKKIEEVVYSKRKWIVDKLKFFQDIKKPIPEKHEPISGEKILLKNKRYRLKIHKYSKKRTKIVFICGILHIYVNNRLSEENHLEEIKKILIRWYKNNAYKIIQQRIQKFNIFLDYRINGIKIRDLKKRWGSCTKDNNLIFNWRIIMAPISAIDYIVIHELIHLNEPLHTKKFWDLIGSIFPDYEKWKEWLRINGPSLDLRF